MNAAHDPNWQPDPQLLAAYFDGELEGRDDLADLRARIETWLEAHSEAAGEYTQHQMLKTLWLDTTPAEPSAATWNQALERIDARRKQPIAQPAAGNPWLAAGAVAASIALFFGVLFGALRLSLPADPTNNPQVHAPKDSDDNESFPVATAGEVTILRVEGADTGALVVGELPLEGPLELADPGEVRVVHVQPDARDQMRPHVRQDGPHRPMIWARLDTD